MHEGPLHIFDTVAEILATKIASGIYKPKEHFSRQMGIDAKIIKWEVK